MAKTTVLLLVWPRDAKRLDTPAHCFVLRAAKKWAGGRE